MLSITALADKVRAGERVGADEALELYVHAPTAIVSSIFLNSSSKPRT